MKTHPILCVLFLALGVLSACKNRSNPAAHKVEAAKLDFNYFSTKAKVDYSDQHNEVSANLVLRIKNNQIIWASISKLGKEAIRVKLLPDSTYLLSKYPADNRFYSVLPTKEYLQKAGIGASFASFQGFVFGSHQIKTLKKDTVSISDSVIDLVQWRNGVRVASQLDARTSKLNHTQIITKTDTVSIRFGDYQTIDGNYIPTHLSFEVSALQDTTRTKSKTEVSYSKPSFSDDELSFPYRVPDGYEKR